jgi:multidrug efflux system membrane fusion protein
VIDGADKLRDGAKINVRAEAADPNAPSAGGGAAPGSEKAGKKRRSDGGQKQDNEQKQDGGQKQ